MTTAEQNKTTTTNTAAHAVQPSQDAVKPTQYDVIAGVYVKRGEVVCGVYNDR